MDISVAPEQEELVHRLVETGRYGSAAEVIGEALRLIETRDQLDAVRSREIRAEIAAGIASLRAGRTVDGEAVFDRLDAELESEELRAST